MPAKKYLNEERTQELINKIRTDYATKADMASAFIPKGSVAFASLPATLAATNLGWVYNVTDAFTVDNRFVEYDGSAATQKSFPAGSDIVVIDADTTGSSPSYKFNVLAGFVDLSGYQEKNWSTAKSVKEGGTTYATVETTIDALISEKFDDANMIPITAAELTAMWTNPLP